MSKGNCFQPFLRQKFYSFIPVKICSDARFSSFVHVNLTTIKSQFYRENDPLNPLFLLTSRKSIFGKIAILSYFWLFFELFVKLHKKMTSDKNIKGHFLCSCSYKFLVSKLFYLMFQAKKFAPFYAKVYCPRTIYMHFLCITLNNLRKTSNILRFYL